MTKEELLKPRVKIIAPWLGMEEDGYSVGHIETGDESSLNNEALEKYPHLLRRLEWWEERDEDLRGTYIRAGKLDKAHTCYRLIEPVGDMYGLWKMEGPYGEWVYHLGNVTVPITKEEFDQYIKSKK